MKITKNNLVILFVIVSLVFAGCHDSSSKDLPNGLYYNVEQLPDINLFSNTEYEAYQCQFPSVASAVFRCGDTESAISPNDPRLIQLLNFLSYSEEKMFSTWLQGYVTKAEQAEMLSNEAPMLEINFRAQETLKGYVHTNAVKAIICGDSYLLYTDSHIKDNQEYGEYLVDRYWPYGCFIEEMNIDMLSYDGWGKGYWIDIVTYAGF